MFCEGEGLKEARDAFHRAVAVIVVAMILRCVVCKVLMPREKRYVYNAGQLRWIFSRKR